MEVKGLYIASFRSLGSLAAVPARPATEKSPGNPNSVETNSARFGCFGLRSTREIPMSTSKEKPGQQNQTPNQKPGQQQGGGQKPGQQQQDPSRQGQKPDHQGKGER
jgi:hypothetical protein